MRLPLCVVAALALGIASAAAGQAVTPFTASARPVTAAARPLSIPVAAHATETSAPPSPAAAATSAPDLAQGVERSRQRPLFLAAKLNGANEVQVAGAPPVGDSNGSATGLVRVQGNRITFAFNWLGIGAPTLGHIHQGKAGVNGDVKVPLFTTAMPDTVHAAAGIVTVTDPAIADEIRSDPSGFYLNLHTTEFPGGAVRGQLKRLGHITDLISLLHGGSLKAFLSGDQEVPVPAGPAVGDPTGRAVTFIDPRGQSSIDYSAAWIGVHPTLGHIHKGAVGANGPIVVPLFGTPIPATIVAIAGSVDHVDPALTKDIKANPAEFYTNLHTVDFPGGAVRGQLFKRN
jgi:hypothetical protein